MNLQKNEPTKAEMKLLEKLYSHEIEAAITPAFRGPFQTKSRLIKKMEEDGLVQAESVTLNGRFPVIIKGYQLTHLGRILYCSCCDVDDDDL